MTAPSPDLAEVERDIIAVLTAHGLAAYDTVQIAVYPIEQAGQTAGVSITGMAYTPPPGVPAPRPATDSLVALAEDLEAAL